MGSDGGSNSSGDESEMEQKLQELDSLDIPEKKRKPGIIYLSSVPQGMNVSSTTGFFAEFGHVGRVFLQPDAKLGMRHFTEGWIEFMSKKIAKRVAAHVNNTPVAGKKHKNNSLWNIKYLPRFKWVHLSERLAYEKAVKQQRMRTEISQVKREAELFKGSVKSTKKKKRARDESEPPHNDTAKKKKREGEEDELPFHFMHQQEVPGGKKAQLGEPKEKKTKKGKKSKEKEEVSKSSPKTKEKKSTKKKKKSGKKSDVDISDRPEVSKKKKKETASRAKKVSDSGGRKRPEAVTRRKSGDGDRAAFLKSVFGGAT